MKIKIGSIVQHKESKSVAKVLDRVGDSVYATVTKGCGVYNKGDDVIWLDYLVQVV